MKIEEAKEKGLRFLAPENLFESDGNGHVWDILQKGAFEDAELTKKEYPEEKIIWCKKMDSKISASFIQDLIHDYFDENDEMFFDDGKAAELIDGTDLEAKALAEKVSANFDKQRWYSPTEFEVEF